MGLACALVCLLSAVLLPSPVDAAVVGPPLASGVSTAGDSWLIIPMGDLSNRSNTFWQLFHAAPGSSHWSLVTPPGVADNGGLVAGPSAGSVLAGILPSNLLRFSPLSQSSDGGTSWSPTFFPTGLAPLPDALAYREAAPGGALAVTAGGARALVARGDLSSWSTLVSVSVLRRVSPGCGVSSLDAVAILPTGAPLVATGCRRGGQVGLFTRTAAPWEEGGPVLQGSLRGAATEVLRLAVTGSTTTVLVWAGRGGHRGLVALWRTGDGRWTESPALAASPGTTVLSTAVGANGALAVLMGAARGRRSAFDVDAGGAWSPLPQPPSRTMALAMPAGPATLDSVPVDAFTVDGGSLGVYALTPSGATWVRVQSSQIPLAYGSSG